MWPQGRLKFIPLTAAYKDADTAPKHFCIYLCTGADGHAALLSLLGDKLMQAGCNVKRCNKGDALC